MITESTIYWITRLDGIHTALIVGMFIFGILFFTLLLVAFDCNDENMRFKTLLFGLPLLFSIIAGLVYLPTTKEMCAIKVIPAIANNQSVQELGNQTVEIAKEWLNDLRPKRGE